MGAARPGWPFRLRKDHLAVLSRCPCADQANQGGADAFRRDSMGNFTGPRFGFRPECGKGQISPPRGSVEDKLNAICATPAAQDARHSTLRAKAQIIVTLVPWTEVRGLHARSVQVRDAEKNRPGISAGPRCKSVIGRPKAESLRLTAIRLSAVTRRRF